MNVYLDFRATVLGRFPIFPSDDGEYSHVLTQGLLGMMIAAGKFKGNPALSPGKLLKPEVTTKRLS